jgi:hypothetical protein
MHFSITSEMFWLKLDINTIGCGNMYRAIATDLFQIGMHLIVEMLKYLGNLVRY